MCEHSLGSLHCLLEIESLVQARHGYICCKGLVIIYRLGGGTENFRGDHLILGQQNFEGFIGDTTQICL